MGFLWGEGTPAWPLSLGHHVPARRRGLLKDGAISPAARLPFEESKGEVPGVCALLQIKL